MPDNQNEIPQSIQRLLEEREYRPALIETERELLASPLSVPLWVAKARALLASEQQAELLAWCDQLTETYPDATAAHALKADALEVLGRDEEALTSYARAAELEPGNVVWLSSKARVLQRLGRAAETLAVLDRIEELSPGDPDNLIARGDALLSDGRVEEAFLAFEQVAQVAPATFGAGEWDNRGDTLFARADADMALRFYEKAIAADSQYAWAYRGKSRVLNKLLGQPDGALRELDKAILIDEKNTWFYIDKGNILFDRKQYGEAEQCYRKATEIDPKYEDAWSNLGLAQENLGRYEDAVLSTQKALELNPLYLDAWIRQGYCLGMLRKFEEAEAAYAKALELQPENVSAIGNMGWVLGELKKNEEALRYHREYIELNPGDPVAWINEAESLIHLRRCQEALQHLQKGLEVVSDAHDLYATMGYIYADFLFQHERALEAYQQCLNRQPNNLGVSCSMAECLVITGRYAEGRAKAEGLMDKMGPDHARALSLVALTSYALEGDLEGRGRQFDDVLQRFTSFRKDGDSNERVWKFDGLVNKIRTSAMSAESKFLIMTAIDIEQDQMKKDALSFFEVARTA